MIHSDQWGGYMHGAIAAIPVIPPYIHQSVNHTRFCESHRRDTYEPCGELLEKYQNEIQVNARHISRINSKVS